MSIDFSLDYEAPIVTTSFTPNDESEYSLRPKRLYEYNGQEKVKENLNVYIEAAKRRNELPADIMLILSDKKIAEIRRQSDFKSLLSEKING